MEDLNTEGMSVAMDDDKTTDGSNSNDCLVAGNLAVDMNDIEPVIDDCGLMEQSENGQKVGSVSNECADEGTDLSQLDTIQQNECELLQDDAQCETLKLDGDQDLPVVSESAQCSDPVKSPDTGVDGDLLLLTLEGSSDKQDVLINELQTKEKIISELRVRVAELEAQLGIMPNLRSSSSKRPPSRFIDHITPSLKRARARSSTPSRRISVHLKSLKRARLRSPMCLGSDWKSGAEHADMISQSSILSPEDMDVLAVEVSHRLSSHLVSDITEQVLQQVLPLMDLHTDAEHENNHIGDIPTASTSSQLFSADNTNSTTSVQSGQSTQVSLDFVQTASNSSITATVSSTTSMHLAAIKTADVTVPHSNKVASLIGSHLIAHTTTGSVVDETTSVTGSPLVVSIPNSASSSKVSLIGSDLIVKDLNMADSSDVTALEGSHLIIDHNEGSVPRSGEVTLLTGSHLISESNAESVSSEQPSSNLTQPDKWNHETKTQNSEMPKDMDKDDDTEINSILIEKTITDMLSSSSSNSSTEAVQDENNLDMVSSEALNTASADEKEKGQKNYMEKSEASVVSRPAEMAGSSSSSGTRHPASSSKSSAARPINVKVHIPNIFRQRPVHPQNVPRHISQMPVRHPVGMSPSAQFSLNMQRMAMQGNMNSPSPNAMMMQQLINTPAGAQAAQALSHLNQMNRLATMQAQQRGTRPQLQNARFPQQVSPLMSPGANSAGAGINMGQARNIAMTAAFRRAMSSRVLTGQGLNMNNR